MAFQPDVGDSGGVWKGGKSRALRGAGAKEDPERPRSTEQGCIARAGLSGGISGTEDGSGGRLRTGCNENESESGSKSELARPWQTAAREGHRIDCMPLSHRQRLAAKDINLALNSWMPHQSPNAVSDQKDTETWEVRTALVEAERLAAAADAIDFYKDFEEKREKERTYEGLALKAEIREARVAPWSEDIAAKLSFVGNADSVEKAVREYEPPRLFSDPHQRWAVLLLEIVHICLYQTRFMC